MMKWFVLFLVIFSLISYYFGKDEVSNHYRNAKISKATAYTTGYFNNVDYGILDDRFRYKYKVDGIEYYILSSSQTITKESIYKNGIVEIAYSREDPSKGTLKTYFEKRDRYQTILGVIFTVGLLALAISIPIWLLFYTPVWLFRKWKKWAYG